MTMTTLMQIRVDSTLKQEADKLFSELGLDTTTAMRIFLKTAVRERKLPFEVALSPTKNTEIEELERRLEDIKTKRVTMIHKTIEELEALENA